MSQWIVNARFLTQPITGVQRFAIEISKELKKLDPAIIFVAPANIIHHDLAKELDAVTFGRYTGHFWEQFELPNFLKNNNNPLLINLANTSPLRYNNFIATIHDLSFLQFPDCYSKKFYYFYKFLIPRIAKKAQKIITVSDNARQNISKIINIDPAKIAVVNNAVSPDFKYNTQPLTSEYGRYILTVASFNPIKNIKNLILAYQQIKDKNIKLVIAGNSNASFSKDNFITHAINNENIIFTGHIASAEKLFNLYSNAELFILPSFYESFGIPNIEAMICNCPVITSDAGALREICGNAALYINPYNIYDISAAIDELLINKPLRKQLINNGLEIIKKYNWKNSASQLFELANNI